MFLSHYDSLTVLRILVLGVITNGGKDPCNISVCVYSVEMMFADFCAVHKSGV